MSQQGSSFKCFSAIASLNCSRCTNFETHTLVDLRRHFKTGHTLSDLKQKRHKCRSCTFRTHSRFLYLTHKFINPCTSDVKVESVKASDHFRCPFCSYSTLYEANLSNHTKRVHKSHRNNLPKCQLFPEANKMAAHLRNHILAKHADRDRVPWFECEHCSYRTKRKADFKDHVAQIHEKPKKFKCSDCQFATKYKFSLRNHVLVKHTDTEKLQWLQCSHCSFRTKLNLNFKNHVYRMHNNKGKLRGTGSACPHCPFTTSTKHQLKRHLYRVHGSTFTCDRCAYQTKFRDTLKNHILLRHTKPDEVQWFECEMCSFRTKTKSYLKKHARHRHGTEKKFKCDQCQYETKYKNALKDHVIAKHHVSAKRSGPDQIQWFYCPNCTFKSKRRGHLKAHVDYVHGEKEKLKCEHCPFESIYKKSLKNHVLAKHT